MWVAIFITTGVGHINLTGIFALAYQYEYLLQCIARIYENIYMVI